MFWLWHGVSPILCKKFLIASHETIKIGWLVLVLPLFIGITASIFRLSGPSLNIGSKMTNTSGSPTMVRKFTVGKNEF
ncbi:MAG TPA: hypothetical protein VMT35_00735 [Ignavibacteriaceae bacterium]|nr:hypothetical protein [Ignavibacteriaceae bacterium]